MKISDFFGITKFGGVLAAAVLAAAIMFIIQLGWVANNRLVKMESEHVQMSKENKEEFEKINATLADHSMILGEIQSQLEDLNGIKSAVDTNEANIEGLDQKTEFLRGQVETILSNK